VYGLDQGIGIGTPAKVIERIQMHDVEPFCRKSFPDIILRGCKRRFAEKSEDGTVCSMELVSGCHIHGIDRRVELPKNFLQVIRFEFFTLLAKCRGG